MDDRDPNTFDDMTGPPPGECEPPGTGQRICKEGCRLLSSWNGVYEVIENCPRHSESNVAALEGKLALADATYRDSEHCLRQRIAEIAALEATVKALREALEAIELVHRDGDAGRIAHAALRDSSSVAPAKEDAEPATEKETK